MPFGLLTMGLSRRSRNFWSHLTIALPGSWEQRGKSAILLSGAGWTGLSGAAPASDGLLALRRAAVEAIRRVGWAGVPAEAEIAFYAAPPGGAGPSVQGLAAHRPVLDHLAPEMAGSGQRAAVDLDGAAVAHDDALGRDDFQSTARAFGEPLKLVLLAAR